MKKRTRVPEVEPVKVPPVQLPQQLRRLRQLRGWSQLDVARRIGVERTLIGNYEQGLNHPPLITLQKLARAFEVPMDYLVNGEARPTEGFQDRELLEFCLKADKLDYTSRAALKRIIEGLLAREPAATDTGASLGPENKR